MNQEPSSRQLRKEFDKPPTPELKPEIKHRFDPEKRMLPGRPTFGGGNAVPPIKGEAAKASSMEQARKTELDKQLATAQREFAKMQARELQRKKDRLTEKQAPERLSIKNELTEIRERKDSRNKSGASKMLYKVSGQSAKDAERTAFLESRKKALDQEVDQGLHEFGQSQEDERLRFGENIEFERNKSEYAISQLGRDHEHTASREQARTIQRTEGRDGR